ncbi:sensor histidine kinase [Brachybacterium paraconglomeratum]|uniref:sensor histidine kinase n=1 Tax=Brachybacterium paraconglomeratum TaxID=173362 RepID=UPI0037C84292
MTTLPRSLARVEWMMDLAAAIAIGIAVSQWVADPAALQLVCIVLAIVTVLVRRRMPVLAAAGAVLTSCLAFSTEHSSVAIWVTAEVVLFTLALRRGRDTTLALALLHGGALFAGAVFFFSASLLDPSALILPVWTAAVVAAGLALRANYERMDALRQRALHAEIVKEHEVRSRVDAERLRIARDLHDSVAHTVAVISIHAAAAERWMQADPERAQGSLREVRSTARTVIDELQNILAVLRSDGETDDLGEPPGITAVPSLVHAMRATGMPITFGFRISPDVDPAAGAAVYRIVQESLTNAHRHGDGGTHVTVDTGGGNIEIAISNRASAPEPGRSGYGLTGMRERALSVHGTLRTQFRDGTFSVRASIPLVQHHREEQP